MGACRDVIYLIHEHYGTCPVDFYFLDRRGRIGAAGLAVFGVEFLPLFSGRSIVITWATRSRRLAD